MKTKITALLFAAALGTCSTAWAAGGHHAVDDAAILDPGQCQLETWYDHESGGSRRLLHLGPACRIGAVEVGLNFDRLQAAKVTGGGPQVKWATALSKDLSVGVLASANWLSLSSHYGFTSIVVPVSWQVSEQVALHVNAGRDFRAGKSDISRAGASVEWAPNATWMGVAERWRENGFNYARVGGRWNVSPALSLDLSRARSVGSGPPGWWTLGVTLVWGS